MATGIRDKVAILGMGGVETDGQTERLVLGTTLHKLNRPIACDFGKVTRGTVRLFLESYPISILLPALSIVAVLRPSESYS